MTSAWTSDVLAGFFVAIVSGTAGAAYQLHRRRSRPFVLVTEIKGDTVSPGERVVVPTDTCRRIEDCGVAWAPPRSAELGEVQESLLGLSSLTERGPELSSLLSEAVKGLHSATDDRSVIDAIMPPLNKTLFDVVITRALMTGKVAIQPPAAQRPQRVEVYYEENVRGGCFYFKFPTNVEYFGKNLNERRILKDQLSRFTEIVRTLDRDSLLAVFSELARATDGGIAVAQAAKPQLQEILEKHSKWEARLYVANYGETAMLILPAAALEVRRRRLERPRREECRLIAYRRAGDSRSAGVDEETGVLVAPGGELRLVFATTHTQMSMEGGNELRGLFEDGKSQARVVFRCISAGLRPARRVRTPWRAFKEGP